MKKMKRITDESLIAHWIRKNYWKACQHKLEYGNSEHAKNPFCPKRKDRHGELSEPTRETVTVTVTETVTVTATILSVASPLPTNILNERNEKNY
ncbi:MAG: hypothetical protein GC181_10585 [Bacteroidetes bacterium]|nr:hypothetical protein [Bacteroidota bacterium]